MSKLSALGLSVYIGRQGNRLVTFR
ncbi:hypothetical protein BVI434_3880001 [Burkholderia vietnamiensis]|nr:hypothetical protein BVI434_3880001 [Burkholderia vietnamiensis]CAG9230964.1 hypothetical protein BVI1335_750067 [Burkholderia vietnamiensis]